MRSALHGLDAEAPLIGYNHERPRRRVGQEDDVADDGRCASIFEQRQAHMTVTGGREADRRRALVEQVAGDRLRDRPPRGRDLVQVEVVEAVAAQ